ncbi:MAG: TerB family tellurite resistance protein [Sulfitobacter sp.]
MFAEFLKKLSGTAGAPLPDADARLALCALLVRIARSDNHYAPAERARIDQIIAQRYALDPAATADLRARAEALEAEAPDTVRFTRDIKDAVPYEDRRAVIQSMWSVVLADGGRADEEDALLRLVANLLGVSDTDSALARQKAQAAQ